MFFTRFLGVLNSTSSGKLSRGTPLISNNSGLDNRLVSIRNWSKRSILLSRSPRWLNVLDWLLLNLNSGVLDWLLDNSRLLDVLDWLDLLDWLLDVLDLLDLLGWLMDYLSFNGLVFNSFLDSFLGNVLNNSFLVNLGDVFSLVFNCIIISHLLFSGNIFCGVDWLLDLFVFDFGSFIRNVFYSWFSLNSWLLLNNLNWLLLNVLDWLLLNVLNLWLLNVLDWLRNNLRLGNRLLNVLDGSWRSILNLLLDSAGS